MFFQDLTSNLVMEGLARAREENRKNREAQYDKLWDFYRGGDEIGEYLIRKPAEQLDEFADRLKRLEYPNEVRKIARDLRSNSYGFDVERTLLPPATDAHNVTFHDLLDNSGIGIAQVEYSEAMIVCGDGWALVRWHEAENRLAVDSVLPQNMWAAWDPENASLLSEVVEERVDAFAPLKDGKPVSVFWIWNAREFVLVNADGKSLPHPISGKYGPWPNSYGIIPYVHFPAQPSSGDRYGTSYIRDAVTVQNVILNRRSDLDLLVSDQSHGTLVLSGVDIPKVQSGPKRAVNVGPGGDAKFIQPGADITNVIGSIESSVRWMYDATDMPMNAEVSTASSGLALAIKMRPLTARVEEIRSIATHPEKTLVRTICTIASKHGVQVPTGPACVPKIAFPTNVLPADKDGEFKRDFAQVTAMPPLMTRESFVKKHQGIKDEGELAEYIATLDAEASGYATGQTSGGNASPTSPPPATPPTPPVLPTVPGTVGDTGKEMNLPQFP